MAKRRHNNFRWDPSQTWEINIEALLAARRAGSEWTPARREQQSRAQQKRQRREKRQRRMARFAKHDARAKRPFGKRVPRGQRIMDQIARAMLPGEWYGAADIVGLLGRKPMSVRKRIAEMLARGELDVAADGAGGVSRISGRPRYLYRLTRTGEALRAFALAVE